MLPPVGSQRLPAISRPGQGSGDDKAGFEQNEARGHRWYALSAEGCRWAARRRRFGGQPSRSAAVAANYSIPRDSSGGARRRARRGGGRMSSSASRRPARRSPRARPSVRSQADRRITRAAPGPNTCVSGNAFRPGGDVGGHHFTVAGGCQFRAQPRAAPVSAEYGPCTRRRCSWRTGGWRIGFRRDCWPSCSCRSGLEPVLTSTVLSRSDPLGRPGSPRPGWRCAPRA